MVPLERWQAYDEQGNPLQNGGVTKQQAADGALHGASHIWIWRKKDGQLEVLLQKRASDKRTWPGFWDIAAAGHIDFGETPEQAALREAQEEIGLKLRPEDLKLLFVRRDMLRANEEIIENEWRWVFGVKLKDDIAFKYTDHEVSSTRWVHLDELEKLIAGESENGKIVPQGPEYFAQLLESIKAHS